MKNHKYVVKLVRPVFQAVVVEVSATDETTAAMKAVEQAEKMGDRSWEEISESTDYRCHPVTIRERADIRDIDDLLYDGRYKYLLLQADTQEAEGELLMQPWAVNEDSLVFADAASDWQNQIETVYGRGVQAWVADMEDIANSSDTRAIAKAIIAQSLQRRR
jgi:hypothetical protein